MKKSRFDRFVEAGFFGWTCHNLSVVFLRWRHTIGLQTQNDFAAAKPPRVTERCEQYEQQQERGTRGSRRYEPIQDAGCQRGGRQPEAGLQRRPNLQAGRFRRWPDGRHNDTHTNFTF